MSGFHECVLAWLKQHEWYTNAEEVLNVTGDGTDWSGGTEEGFRSRFSVDVKFRSSNGGMIRTITVGGDDMEDLWDWVVARWPADVLDATKETTQ